MEDILCLSIHLILHQEIIIIIIIITIFFICMNKRLRANEKKYNIKAMKIVIKNTANPSICPMSFVVIFSSSSCPTSGSFMKKIRTQISPKVPVSTNVCLHPINAGKVYVNVVQEMFVKKIER